MKERLGQAGAKAKSTAAQYESILFGWQALYTINQAHAPTDQAFSSTKRIIVITKGEIDALSLAAYGYPPVSLPFGGGIGGKHNWIENEFDHKSSIFISKKLCTRRVTARPSNYKDQIIELFWPVPEHHLGYTVPYPKLNGRLYFRPAELTL